MFLACLLKGKRSPRHVTHTREKNCTVTAVTLLGLRERYHQGVPPLSLYPHSSARDATWLWSAMLDWVITGLAPPTTLSGRSPFGWRTNLSLSPTIILCLPSLGLSEEQFFAQSGKECSCPPPTISLALIQELLAFGRGARICLQYGPGCGGNFIYHWLPQLCRSPTILRPGPLHTS